MRDIDTSGTADDNYLEHNEQVNALWESYASGHPVRVPMIIGMNPRIWLLESIREVILP